MAARSEVVYISGEVAKPGAYELNDRDSISITQALALAGGFSQEAQPQKARILRPIMDTPTDRRAATPVDLNKAFSGTANEFPLMPNDALYVPRCVQKRNALGQFVMYTVPGVIAALALAAMQ